MTVEETKIIYHIDDEETPYLIKLPVSSERVTLGDFKNALNRPAYKFFFKSLDDDFGVVKEELIDDESKLPCFNGRVVSWLVTAENSTHSSENQNTSLTTTKQSFGANESVGVTSGPTRPASYYEKDDSKCLDPCSDMENKKVRPHLYNMANQRMPMNCDVASSVMTSDIESVSVLDTDDTQSRCSGTTSRSSAYVRSRKKKYRHRMPIISQASSMSSITDSTMSLNVINVTLNMETVNFLGISIVGQTNIGGDGGIYVGSIMKGGAVALDGRIEPGDMILEVNGVSFEDMTNDEAVHALRSAAQRPGPVTLVVAKCWDPNPKGYNMAPRQEVVHPIDPSAWVAHTEAVRAMYGRINLPPPLPSGVCNNGPIMAAIPECTLEAPCSYSPTSSNILNNSLSSDPEPLTTTTDPSSIVHAMLLPDSGLDIRDRMWLKIIIPHAFIGSDLVTWLLTRVEGFVDRRDARKYACNMLKKGLIKHTVNKLSFSEQCYYTIVDSSQSACQQPPQQPSSQLTPQLLLADDLDHETDSTEVRIYDTLGPPSMPPSMNWGTQYNNKIGGFTTTFPPVPSTINYAPPAPYNFINDALSIDSLHITNGTDTIKSSSESTGSNHSQVRKMSQPHVLDPKRFVQTQANPSNISASSATTTTILNTSTSSSHSDVS